MSGLADCTGGGKGLLDAPNEVELICCLGGVGAGCLLVEAGGGGGGANAAAAWCRTGDGGGWTAGVWFPHDLTVPAG